MLEPAGPRSGYPAGVRVPADRRPVGSGGAWRSNYFCATSASSTVAGCGAYGA